MNKLKTTITLSLIAILGLSKVSFAQESCKDNYIIFNSALKEKNYPLAYQYWTPLVSGTCDEIIKEKKTVYSNGAFVLGKLIKDAGDSKQAKIDSLIWSHEQHIAMFGEDTKSLEKYGKVLYQYRVKTAPSEAQGVLNKAIANGTAKVSYPESYKYYFHTVLIDYQKTKDASKVVTEYLMLMENGERLKGEGAEKMHPRWDKVLAWVESKGIPFLTCDKLMEIFTIEKFESIKDNVEELKKAENLLGSKKCKGDVRVKIQTRIIELIPDAEKTSKDWLTMSKLNITDKKLAQEYLDKAISMETENSEKSKMYEFGTTISESKYYGQWGKAIPSDGAPKLYEARRRANSANKAEVGETIALRSLVYSLAMDYCDKAATDSKVSSQAKRLKESYKGRLPSKTEMFQEAKNVGDSYTVPYWKEKTTVRCR